MESLPWMTVQPHKLIVPRPISPIRYAHRALIDVSGLGAPVPEFDPYEAVGAYEGGIVAEEQMRRPAGHQAQTIAGELWATR